jgi:glutathione synthase/RimK-type ligase-like ATP-grasp enzyme
MTAVLGVLVSLSGASVPPQQLPLGRAALSLEGRGVPVVFGDDIRAGEIWGLRATPGGWEASERAPLAAVYDRFASQRHAGIHDRLLRAIGGVPIANPPSLVSLCRDKLACQVHLEGKGIQVPEVEDDPTRFRDRLDAWGAGFLKPRYGAFGRGVRRVLPGDALPAEGEGAQAGVLEPLLLQRAIAPPSGYAGVCVRLLAHRRTDGGWTLAPAVARHSHTDPVVNVARGADAAAAADLLGDVVTRRLEALALDVCAAMAEHPDGSWLVEVGVDLVVDPRGVPWPLEVNGRPRGRVAALAERDPERFSAAHAEASVRPLAFLAARTGML